MTPEQLQKMQQLEQQLAQVAAERDALQAELISLKADMFVLNNDMGYTTGVLEDVLKQRDALQARIDWALAALKQVRSVPIVRHLIKILTGEGENA